MRTNGRKIQFASHSTVLNVISDSAEFMSMALDGDLERLKEYMVRFPEVVNLHDKNHGNVALHVASSKGNIDMMSLLLRYGADYNIKDIFGNSSLHYASDKGNKEAVNLLITSGADVDIQDNRGSTCLHVACKNNDIELVRILLRHKANSEIIDLAGQRAYDKTTDHSIQNMIGRIKPFGETDSAEMAAQTIGWMSFGIGLGTYLF